MLGNARSFLYPLDPSGCSCCPGVCACDERVTESKAWPGKARDGGESILTPPACSEYLALARAHSSRHLRRFVALLCSPAPPCHRQTGRSSEDACRAAGQHEGLHGQLENHVQGFVVDRGRAGQSSRRRRVDGGFAAAERGEGTRNQLLRYNTRDVIYRREWRGRNLE